MNIDDLKVITSGKQAEISFTFKNPKLSILCFFIISVEGNVSKLTGTLATATTKKNVALFDRLFYQLPLPSRISELQLTFRKNISKIKEYDRTLLQSFDYLSVSQLQQLLIKHTIEQDDWRVFQATKGNHELKWSIKKQDMLTVKMTIEKKKSKLQIAKNFLEMVVCLLPILLILGFGKYLKSLIQNTRK